MHLLGFMSFGLTEMLVIGTVALLVFGGELPDVMRNLGRAYGKFRQGLQDMSKPVREEFRRVRDEVPNIPSVAEVMAPPAPASEQGSAEDVATSSPTTYDVGTPPDDGSTTNRSAISDDAWDDLDEPPPV